MQDISGNVVDGRFQTGDISRGRKATVYQMTAGVEQTEVEQTGWNRRGEEAGENANNPGNMVFSPSAS